MLMTPAWYGTNVWVIPILDLCDIWPIYIMLMAIYRLNHLVVFVKGVRWGNTIESLFPRIEQGELLNLLSWFTVTFLVSWPPTLLWKPSTSSILLIIFLSFFGYTPLNQRMRCSESSRNSNLLWKNKGRGRSSVLGPIVVVNKLVMLSSYFISLGASFGR